MKSEAGVFFTYLGREAVQPSVYISAMIIGSMICFLTGIYSPVPFGVPLCVQILVRANVKFRHRHQDALVELPAQKEDPVFIMDRQGRVILSVGKTRALFGQYNIENIKGFISEEAFARVMDSISPVGEPSRPGVEVFSGKTLKWYEVRATATAMAYGGKTLKILVWFQDISQRQVYALRLKDLLRYSDTLIHALEEGEAGMETTARHLAIFLLKEYGGTFISRTDSHGNLNGYAFKVADSRIVRSENIHIPKDSFAPVNVSRQTGRVISDHVSAWESDSAFLAAYPFDPRVIAFLDRPVENFITCHKADVSIIAFNFRSRISLHEREFFKVVVNIFKTMTVVADLKA